MLCWFLPYININQSWVYICPLPLEPLSHLPPIPPLQVTEHGFELPESYSKFPLAICFTYGSGCVSMLLSPFVPPSPSPLCLQACSPCLSPLLPCKQVHWYHLPRFHIYALIYDFFLFLTYFTLYNNQLAPSDWKVKHMVFKPLCLPPIPTDDITSQSQQPLPVTSARQELKIVLTSALQTISTVLLRREEPVYIQNVTDKLL